MGVGERGEREEKQDEDSESHREGQMEGSEPLVDLAVL